MKPIVFDKIDHTTICKRQVRNKIYTGKAICHPHDYDFESTLVGQNYAYSRSLIAELCDNRDAKAEQLKVLKHVYNIMEQNKNVRLESEECYILRRQIAVTERDLQELRDLIRAMRKDLRNTIEGRDKMYARLREIRREQNVSNYDTERV